MRTIKKKDLFGQNLQNWYQIDYEWNRGRTEKIRGYEREKREEEAKESHVTGRD